MGLFDKIGKIFSSADRADNKSLFPNGSHLSEIKQRQRDAIFAKYGISQKMVDSLNAAINDPGTPDNPGGHLSGLHGQGIGDAMHIGEQYQKVQKEIHERGLD